MSFKKVFRHGTRFTLGVMVFNIGNLLYWFILRLFMSFNELGYAVTLLSTASLVSVLISPGLIISILRNISVKGLRTYLAAIIISAIALLPGGVLEYILLSKTFTGLYEYFTVVLAITALMCFFITGVYGLMGLELSWNVAITYSLFTVLRILLTVLLAKAGLGVNAVLYGTLLAYVMAVVYANTGIMRNINNTVLPSIKDVKDTLLLGIANYPYTISTQTYYSIGALIVAYSLGNPEITGKYYFLLILLIVLQSIPIMYLNAALPVAVKLGERKLIEHTMKKIAVLVSLVATPIAVSPLLVSKILVGEHIASPLAIQLVPLAAIPVTIFVTVLMYYNYLYRLISTLIVGLLRITSFVLMAIVLSPYYGLTGVSASILASNILPVATSKLMSLELSLADVSKIFLVQLGVTLAFSLTPIPEVVKLATSPLVLLLLLISLGLTSIKELREITVAVASSLSSK